MPCYMMEERQSIKDSLRCLKKYGSIANNNNYAVVPSHLIRHMVSENDTLQGISLKYGVTTEDIRRVNKLWANDSLFLRESLLIPVKNGAISSPNSTCILDASSEPDFFVNQASEDITDNGFSRSDSLRSSASSYRIDDDLDNYSDFLTRIDADIANKRHQLRISQDKSLFAQETSNPYNRKKPALSRLKQQQQSSSSQSEQHWHETSFDIPAVTTHGKDTRSSMPRVQKNQEQLFEL